MKAETAHLSGAALDWAVAIAQGAVSGDNLIVCLPDEPHQVVRAFGLSKDTVSSHYSPSTIWSQGGRIIDNENITVGPWDTSPAMAHMPGPVTSTNPRVVGPTKLIAAMRCYVASKLGDEVEIPDSLLA